MAKNKTVETDGSVEDYLREIADETRRDDCKEIIGIIKDRTGLLPKMWGAAIVGFGSYHYKYDSGHEGDAPLSGFSSRSNAIALYLPYAFDERDELLKMLGKFKSAKACIYVKKLEDVDTKVLGDLFENGIKFMKEKYHFQ